HDKEEPKHYDFYGYIYYSVTSSHKIVKFDEASLEVLNLKANNLSDEYYSTDKSLAIIYADSAISLAEKINYQSGLGYGLMYKGLAYEYAGEIQLALAHYDSAAVCHKICGDHKGMGKAISNIGVAYFYNGNYDEAVIYLLESIPHFEKANYVKGLASVLNNLGLISRKKGEYPLALDYYNQSLDYKREMGDLKGEMLTLVNVCALYIYLEDWKKALIANNQSIQIAIELESDQLAESYVNRGVILDRIEQNHEALKYYHKAEPLLIESGFNKSLIMCYLGIANIYLEENELDSSALYLNRSMSLLDEAEYTDYRLKALQGLTAVNREKGNYKASLGYLQDYVDLTTQIADESRSDEVKELESKYNYLAQKEKIGDLKKDKEIRDLKIAQNDFNALILWIAIAAMLIILVYIAFIYRRMKAQKEIASLALTDKEVLLKEVHHRVKNNLQLVSSLLYLQSEEISDDAALKAITVSRTRVEAMAIIHQKLYKEENIIGISTTEYVDDLVEGIFDTLGLEDSEIIVTKKIDSLSLDIDSTIPIGLILNELITNSIKHAFPADQNKKEIRVELVKKEGYLRLKVADNGIGNDKLNIAHSSGFGQKLIDMFAKKLRAEKIIETENGYSVELRIKKYTLQE
ncbi:MAG: tetratricopeptide repeat protein, partial [Crocinitomix sp.]|nr:tetratricopeptide repeat protein [Crocinitomix sp.]